MTTAAQTYVIGIKGHDISRSRVIRHTGTLASAKKVADAEFGGGFDHHTIVICDAATDWAVAERKMSRKNWRTV